MVDDEGHQELIDLLESIGKSKFLDKLVEAKILSLKDLTTCETLPSTIPKMTTRILKKKALDAIEIKDLQKLLKVSNKIQFLDSLLSKNIRTPEALYEVPIEVLVEEIGIPRMTCRMLKKKSKDIIETRELQNFLKDINKENFLDVLIKANYKTPKDIKDSTFEDLVSKTNISRMVVRRLMKYADEVCVPDIPDYEINLTDENKANIRDIWSTLRDANQSFGTNFYEGLVRLDKKALNCFSGVSLSSIGTDLDDMIEKFVNELDKPNEFATRRDALVSRLLHYRVLVQTLWFGEEAFKSAVISNFPESDVIYDLTSWGRFYRALFPPLHPTILKSLDLITEDDWNFLCSDILPKLHEGLARRGFLFYTEWLKDQCDFSNKLWSVIESLTMFQNGKESWTTFLNKSQLLLEGLNSDHQKVALLIEIPLTVSDRYGKIIGYKLGNTLYTVICGLFGIDSLNDTYRANQRELVSDQWSDIYRLTPDEFGENFYNRFIKSDPLIKEVFKSSHLAMQRDRFKHQWNAVLIRINEDMEMKLRPMLLELGARHRVHYLIGCREMMAIFNPMMDTLLEMIGKSNWTDEVSNAWSYVLTIVSNCMMVGWTCGFRIQQSDTTRRRSIIGQSNIHIPSKLPNKKLRNFRDESPKEFKTFFDRFANSLQEQTSSSSRNSNDGNSNTNNRHHGDVSTRYCEAVNRILDEVSETDSTDRILAIGRRHRRYHGVTVEQLVSASKNWIMIASTVFGKRFTKEVAIEWLLLWETLAVSMSSEYREAYMSLDAMMKLVFPEVEVKVKKLPKFERTKLTLTKRIAFDCGQVYLTFNADKPVQQKAGQFAKLRWIVNGKEISRFYSIASCPDIKTGTTTSFEFSIKEVKGGKLSPYLVNSCDIADECEIVSIAGNFILPQPIDGMTRLMISAGIGIIAFMSNIRSVVAQIRSGHIKKKVFMSLIHSERAYDFPFQDELLSIAKEFYNHDMFQFHYIFCYTGNDKHSTKLQHLQSEKYLKVHLGRSGLDLFSSEIKQFDTTTETPVYACGPGNFQRSVRETMLKKLGLNRRKIYLEFFDL